MCARRLYSHYNRIKSSLNPVQRHNLYVLELKEGWCRSIIMFIIWNASVFKARYIKIGIGIGFNVASITMKVWMPWGILHNFLRTSRLIIFKNRTNVSTTEYRIVWTPTRLRSEEYVLLERRMYNYILLQFNWCSHSDPFLLSLLASLKTITKSIQMTKYMPFLTKSVCVFVCCLRTSTFTQNHITTYETRKWNRAGTGS